MIVPSVHMYVAGRILQCVTGFDQEGGGTSDPDLIHVDCVTTKQKLRKCVWDISPHIPDVPVKPRLQLVDQSLQSGF